MVLKELDRVKEKPAKGASAGEKWVSLHMGIAEKRAFSAFQSINSINSQIIKVNVNVNVDVKK